MTTERKRIGLQAVTLEKKVEITTGVYYLAFEKTFDFVAGQVIALSLDAEKDPRLYSIASGSQSNEIGILFDIHPDGELTPPLSQLEVGQKALMSMPFGKFIWDGEPAMWIATGTGIAPFLSMIQSQENSNITLLHGAKRQEQFYFQTLFEDKMGTNYLRFCTTESGKGLIEGRLTTYLANHDTLRKDIKYYLCGNSQMVVDVRQLLLAKDIPFDHIIAEIYF